VTPLALVAPSESSPFDSIGGLPLHPLVVHVAVVFLPVAALGLIALVLVPRWRSTFGWLVMAGLAVGTAGAIVSKQSGEALAQQVGTPARHAQLGDILPLLAIALSVLALVWFLLERRAAAREAKAPVGVTVLGYLTALVAAAAIVLTVLVGHSGAEAAWGGRVTSTVASSNVTSSGSATTSSADLTMASVQAHSSPSDCWTVVGGNVYNLTDWINQHPGGAGTIESMCGIDATAAFEAQHGGEGRPNRDLEQFLLGPVQT